MKKLFIFILLIVAALTSQQITIPLKKHCTNDRMLVDSNGEFYYNPYFNDTRDLSSYTSNITNSQNLLYYGSLWFFLSGSSQELEFIFDTGSSWLWAGVSGCSGCPSSSTLNSDQYSPSSSSRSITYGSGTISGYISNTTVSVTSSQSQAVTNMAMIAVNSANLPGISSTTWDGILGLLPTTSSGSDLLVNEMKNQGVISDAVFSVYYTNSQTGSEITFGGYNTSRVPHFNNFTFTSLYTNSYWSTGFRRYKYGNTQYGGTAVRAVIDTGSSLFLMPTNDYNEWLSVISNGRTCFTISVYPACHCPTAGAAEFDYIYVLLDNWEYRMDPQQYTQVIDYNGTQT